jgi:TolB-like protein
VVTAEKGVALAADKAKAAAPAAAVAAAEPVKEAAPAPPVTLPPTTVEAAMRRLADKLAVSIKRSLPDEARYSKVAVAGFGESGEISREKQLGTLVPSELSTYLLRDHGLLLVERSQLKLLMKELHLADSGLVEEKDAPQLGKLAGAQALVIGEVADAGDRFLVNARVVETDTGRVLGAEEGAVPAAGLVALSSEAVVLRSTTDSVYRSLVLPGWGQFYNREPVKGAVFVGAEVAALGLAAAFHLLGQSAEDEYKSAGPEALGATPDERSETALDLRETAEGNYGNRNVLLYVAAGIWAYNVADAWMNGVDGESMLGKGTVAIGAAPGGGANVAVGLSLP